MMRGPCDDQGQLFSYISRSDGSRRSIRSGPYASWCAKCSAI
jgi:hypothetical protein